MADAYIDGRYLKVNAKISTKSKRGREIARELATAILNEVGAIEGDLNVPKRADGHIGEGFGKPTIAPIPVGTSSLADGGEKEQQ